MVANDFLGHSHVIDRREGRSDLGAQWTHGGSLRLLRTQAPGLPGQNGRSRGAHTSASYARPLLVCSRASSACSAHRAMTNGVVSPGVDGSLRARWEAGFTPIRRKINQIIKLQRSQIRFPPLLPLTG